MIISSPFKCNIFVILVINRHCISELFWNSWLSIFTGLYMPLILINRSYWKLWIDLGDSSGRWVWETAGGRVLSGGESPDWEAGSRCRVLSSGVTPGTHLRNATGEMTTEGKGGTYPRPYAYEVSRGVGGGRCGLHFYIWPPGEAELSPTGRFFSCSVYPVVNFLLPHTGNLPLSRGCCPFWQPADRGPLRQASGQSRPRASQAAALGSPTHLGLLLM